MSLSRGVRGDIRAALEHDPAARNVLQVVVFYPGFHARLFHRLAHALWKRRVPFFPRFIAHVTRFFTAIEIHPGAQIGERFFIDHGVGVVIGETTKIGDDVVIYQGVTLGGVSMHKEKRHPTIGNGVVIGAGAKLVGAIEIGANTKIGAGSVVTIDAPPNATVVGVPGRIVAIHRSDTGTVERLPDPVGERLKKLEEDVARLENSLNKLKQKERRKGTGETC